MSDDKLDLDLIAKRVMKLLAPGSSSNSLHESIGGTESMSVRDLAELVRAKVGNAVERSSTLEANHGARSGDAEADAITNTILSRAERSVEALMGGARPHDLDTTDLYSLEAVMQSTGRPAVRVEGNDLEDLARYPGADIWKGIVDEHRRFVLSSCRSAAAVRVTDLLAGGLTWVQGSAWMIAPDLAITNRHVLFPPLGGARLARRIPGTFSARLRKDYQVQLDFDFQILPVSDVRYKILDIPFVSDDADPIDAAILKVEPIVGAADALLLSDRAVQMTSSFYVIGHPGLDPSISGDAKIVFGDPDEKKRVSFGKLLGGVPEGNYDILHDASTIGGFSGGPVLEFMNDRVAGLHYWGDVLTGNRAISVGAMRAHPELSRFISR